MVRFAMICAGVLLLGTAPALSQAPEQRLIVVSSDAPFAHANSGLTLPPTLIGLPRTRVREWEAPQLDINATYLDGDQELTIYVYRTTAGAVPVWFDRTRIAIETRAGWGTPAVVLAPTAVPPPGRTVASGLIAAWSSTGGQYRGSAFALFPLGERLVKLRYSSKALDGTQAAAKMRTAIAGLAWPTAAVDAAPATAIADCASPIRFKGDAKTVKPDSTSVVIGALMAAAVDDDTKTVKPQAWCRDGAVVPTGGVYRPDAADDRYLLALSDAGRGAWVGPSLAGVVGKRKPSWSIDLVLPSRTLTYSLQDRLPAPAQVLQILNGPAVSSTGTWGGKREITLPSNVFK